MLSLFRRNLLLNLIALLLFCAALLGPRWIMDSINAPLWAGALDSWEDFFANKKALSILLSILIITTQALLVNNLIIKNKLSRALSTIPAAVFILISCLFLYPFTIHPILFANLALAISLNYLFKIYKKHQPVTIIFNAGFFLSAACLIYPSYCLYIPLLVISLFTLRSVNIKEGLQIVIGLLTPIFLYCVYRFYSGSLDSLLDYFSTHGSSPWKFEISTDAIIPLAISLLTALLVLAIKGDITKKKKYDGIKKIELFYWLLFLSLFTTFLAAISHPIHLLVISIPLSALFGIFLEGKHNRLLKEVLFLLLLGAYIGLYFI